MAADAPGVAQTHHKALAPSYWASHHKARRAQGPAQAQAQAQAWAQTRQLVAVGAPRMDSSRAVERGAPHEEAGEVARHQQRKQYTHAWGTLML